MFIFIVTENPSLNEILFCSLRMGIKANPTVAVILIVFSVLDNVICEKVGKINEGLNPGLELRNKPKGETCLPKTGDCMEGTVCCEEELDVGYTKCWTCCQDSDCPGSNQKCW